MWRKGKGKIKIIKIKIMIECSIKPTAGINTCNIFATAEKKQSNYLYDNKECYNKFARVYQHRKESGLVAEHLLEPISRALDTEIGKESYRVIELGCGTANILTGLANLPDGHRYNLYGIDFSEKMIEYARKNCLSSERTKNIEIANENVLNIEDVSSLPFEEKDKFDMVIMVALIHLFPEKDARKLLDNVKNLLYPNGLIYIDTTREKVCREAEMTLKKDYGIFAKRLRAYWTKESFEEFLNDCGFDIIYSDDNHESDGKMWLQRFIKIKNG